MGKFTRGGCNGMDIILDGWTHINQVWYMLVYYLLLHGMSTAAASPPAVDACGGMSTPVSVYLLVEST